MLARRHSQGGGPAILDSARGDPTLGMLQYTAATEPPTTLTIPFVFLIIRLCFSSAPAPAPASPGTRISRKSTAELSWRIDEAARDMNSGLGLLRARLTLKQSGITTLKEIEKDVENAPNRLRRTEDVEVQREAREVAQKMEKERTNLAMEEKCRFLAHVPPASVSSKLTVMDPDLYNKWAPRTPGAIYTEGLTKRAAPEPVVMIAMSLSMTEPDFQEKCAGFKKAIADASGTSIDQVSIDRISGTVRINVTVRTRDDIEAAKVCSSLTADAVNAKLMVNGLPRATLVEAPSIHHPRYTVLEFLTHTAGLSVNCASPLVPLFVANGFISRHKIFTMTEEDLKACGVSEDRRRQQIFAWILQGDTTRTHRRQVSRISN